MDSAMKRVLHALPTPVTRKLRFIRDQLAIRTFRSRVAEHSYGGIHLSVQLADSMSARWYDHDWPELPEIKFLKTKRLREGAIVFDLGAHQAVVALTLAKIVGPLGWVLAVEGSQRNFELAMVNKRLNKVDNLEMLHAVVDSGGGSPVSFSDEINGSVCASGSPMASCSIDALALEHGIPDVVMVDVEGYECCVLAGATQTLMADADWCIEVHAGCGLETFGGSADEVVQTFRNGGYSLYYYVDERDWVRALSSEVPDGRFFLIATRN